MLPLLSFYVKVGSAQIKADTASHDDWRDTQHKSLENSAHTKFSET
jgi:hypothetical protein